MERRKKYQIAKPLPKEEGEKLYIPELKVTVVLKPGADPEEVRRRLLNRNKLRKDPDGYQRETKEITESGLHESET